MAKPPKKRMQESYSRFLKSVGKQTDPVMMLLRAHLYSEAVLENLIQIRLPHGEAVNERARLGYYQKLILVQALGILKSPAITALETLNKVRNEFVHEIDKELTFQDVLRIGDSFGKELEDTKQQTGSDTVETLKHMLSYICGHLDGALDRVMEDAKSPAITKKQSP